jgi:hypothetical protein
MRQTLTTVLLSVSATLAIVYFVRGLSEPPAMPVAFGQAAAATEGGILMATAETQNEVFLFVYDLKGKKLASYNVRSGPGIELKGVRDIQWDLSADLQEYPVSTRPTAVKNMKKEIEKAKQDSNK